MKLNIIPNPINTLYKTPNCFRIILSLFLINILGMAVHGQSLTSSPYSIYGIGYLQPKGFGSSSGMGLSGIAVIPESSINDINPASLQGLDSSSFVLEIGGIGDQSNYYNIEGSEVFNTMQMNHYAFGFRKYKWWASGIFISPFSSVGNNFTQLQSMIGSTTNDFATVQINGSGGVNQFCWANAFIFNNLSLGIDISYLMGSMTQSQTTTDPYDFLGNLTAYDKTYLSCLYFDFGFQYTLNFTDKFKTTLGGTYAFRQYLYMWQQDYYIDNTADTIATNTVYGTFNFPTSYGIGLAAVYDNRLTFSADYKEAYWSQSPALQLGFNPVNSNSYNVGLEYIPSRKYGAYIWEKTRYRAGAYYSNMYLAIDGQQLIDKGFTVGVGIPVLRSIFINFAYGYGSRGVPGTQEDIFNEIYKTYTFSISLKDFWFIKRKNY